MNNIFKNSKNSKISDSHRLLLKLTETIISNTKEKYVALLNLSIHYT